MPGPTRWRGDLVSHAVMSNKISQHTLDTRVREVLKLVRLAIKSGVPENAYEGSRDIPETAELLRKISGESIVLLKNKEAVLPFKKTATASFLTLEDAHNLIVIFRLLLSVQMPKWQLTVVEDQRHSSLTTPSPRSTVFPLKPVLQSTPLAATPIRCFP